jgi:hypothetical protein
MVGEIFMKKNLQKISYRQVVCLIGIFVLSFGLFCNQFQQTQAAPSRTNLRCKEHNLKGCASCVSTGNGTMIYHELVPHVVLPETIQYNRVAPKSNTSAPSAGTVSPFVAIYTAFPSYNLPADTEMRQINQLVYPITPKTLPVPLPQKNTPNNPTPKKNNTNEKMAVESQTDLEQIKKPVDSDSFDLEWQVQNSSDRSSDQLLSKKASNKNRKSVANKTYDSSEVNDMFDVSMAILQVSNMEEVVPATPRFALNDNVTQTGIFCNSTPKQPVAWSFSSPIFKIAAVPTGFGNGNGYISQFNPHGGVNVGFQPSPNANFGQPQPTGNFPQNFGQNNGANVQVLPNGMLLLSVPPSHHNCGLLRCRDHNWRYMLLPPAPNQASGMLQTPPQPQLPAPQPNTPDSQAFMYQYPQTMNPYANPYSQQPQIVPVTAMTPYGLAVVGYRQISNMQADHVAFGQGMGNLMAVANNQFSQQYSPTQWRIAQQQLAQQQFIQQQLVQQQLAQQQLAQQKSQSSASQDGTANEDNADESSDLKMPLPINGTANGTVAGNAAQDNTMNLYANPYTMYALQSGNLTVGANNMSGVGKDGVGILGDQPVGNLPAIPNQQFNVLSNPYFANSPTTLPPQLYGSPYGFNPYTASVYPAVQFGGQLGNQYLPLYSQQPYIPVGLQQPAPQQQANQGGLSMTDMLLLMMLMKENNKPQRRLSFFERIAERRAARRQRAEQNDPFNQIMQMWNTPFYADSTARMPAANAYPYGYFGAQSTPINTANYGGYHNLYYGNTTYY